MSNDDLDQIFSYHAPHGSQPHKYETIRSNARDFAHTINDICPESREKSLAITHLQIAVAMANASIAIHEPNPNIGT